MYTKLEVQSATYHGVEEVDNEGHEGKLKSCICPNKLLDCWNQTSKLQDNLKYGSK